MTVRLRKYQERAVAAMGAVLESGCPSQLVAMATGTGKTHTATYWMQQAFHPSTHRVLWVAHTGELIIQGRESALKMDPSFSGRVTANGVLRPATGLVQASLNMDHARWVYATVQTISQKERLRSYLEHGVPDLIVVDEAHHAVSVSQQEDILRTMAWFCQLGNFDTAWEKAHDKDDHRVTRDLLLELKPPFHVVGLTATPKRTDGYSLAQVFERMSYQYPLVEAIKDGYLKPFEAFHVQTQIPFDKVRVDARTGDFVSSSLEAVLQAGNWPELVRDAWKERMANTPSTMVFMPNIDMSREFATAMNAQGVPTGHVDAEMCIDHLNRATSESGMTYHEHRRYMLDAFKNGDMRLLSGFSVLLEGFDAPRVAGILWARPTKSDVVLTQGVGRGLRLYPGIGRQLFDDSEQKWLIQFDNEQWVAYPKDKAPFPTQCTILDFVDVEAGLLTTAKLWGDMRRPASIEKLKEDNEEILDLLDESESLAKQERDGQRDSSKVVDGNGAVYSYKTLFRRSSLDWFAYLGAQSARLGKGKVLFVHPPQLYIVDEIKNRIRVRYEWLHSNKDADLGTIEQRSTEIQDLMTLKQFFDSYSIWIAECPVVTSEEADAKSVEQWWSTAAVARLVDVADDAVTAFEIATPIADRFAIEEDPTLVKKGRKWHSQPITTAQLEQLTVKGFLLKLINQYHVPRPSPAEIAAMKRGDASALRNHLLAHALVLKSMQKILGGEVVERIPSAVSGSG